MNIKRTNESILALLTVYQKFINTTSDEDFARTPAAGVWSYAEVYAHVIRANFSSLLAIEKCIHNKTSEAGNISFIGRLVLLFGKFPPVKLRVPESMAKQVTKISREDARNELVKLKQKLETVIPKLIKCTSGQKIKHPRLGMLNACQWLRFVEVHSNHHLKQLKRVEAMLQNQASKIPTVTESTASGDPPA